MEVERNAEDVRESTAPQMKGDGDGGTDRFPPPPPPKPQPIFIPDLAVEFATAVSLQLLGPTFPNEIETKLR